MGFVRILCRTTVDCWFNSCKSCAIPCRALAWGKLEGRGLVRYALDGKGSETEYLAVAHSRVRVFVGGSSPPPGSHEDSKGGSSGGSFVEKSGVVAPPEAVAANLGTNNTASSAGSSESQAFALGQAGGALPQTQEVKAGAMQRSALCAVQVQKGLIDCENLFDLLRTEPAVKEKPHAKPLVVRWAA